MKIWNERNTNLLQLAPGTHDFSQAEKIIIAEQIKKACNSQNCPG